MLKELQATIQMMKRMPIEMLISITNVDLTSGAADLKGRTDFASAGICQQWRFAELEKMDVTYLICFAKEKEFQEISLYSRKKDENSNGIPRVIMY